MHKNQLKFCDLSAIQYWIPLYAVIPVAPKCHLICLATIGPPGVAYLSGCDQLITYVNNLAWELGIMLFYSSENHGANYMSRGSLQLLNR